MNRVLVGISGGVDSAITAYRLKKEGYDVIGAHLQITEEPIVSREHLLKIENALQIPIHIIHGEEAFKDVVLKAFRNDHLVGRTPSPCTICNPELKWKLLFEKAEEVKADFIASGHYIQKEEIDGIWYLKKGVDLVKDQSYFLWALTQQQLGKMLTPLGAINKHEVKQFAEEVGLEFLAQQKESTGLCFSQGLSYPDLIRKYIPETANISSGNVMNTNSDVVGRHKGYIYYTIGQKRGFEIFHDRFNGYCVIQIDAKNNCLIIDTEQSLWQKEFKVTGSFFTNENKALTSNALEVTVRGIGRNPSGFGRVVKVGVGEYMVTLDNPAWAMAPGQPVVFYENNYLLGGGYMSK